MFSLTINPLFVQDGFCSLQQLINQQQEERGLRPKSSALGTGYKSQDFESEADSTLGGPWVLGKSQKESSGTGKQPTEAPGKARLTVPNLTSRTAGAQISPAKLLGPGSRVEAVYGDEVTLYQRGRHIDSSKADKDGHCPCSPQGMSPEGGQEAQE